jgi:hypothetical protein
MSGFVLRRLAPHAETIKQLYSEGGSFEEIADHFSCGWGTIRRFLISEEVPLRQEPRRRKLDLFGTEVIEAFHAGTDVGDIASRFQVQPQTVRNYLLDRGALPGAQPMPVVQPGPITG